MRRVVCILATVLLASGRPGSAHAQMDEFPFTGPTLDPAHWAVSAVRRAELLGLLEEHLPAQRAVPLEVIGRALEEAAARAEEPGRDAPFSAMVTGWLARWREEYAGAEGSGEGSGFLGGRIGLGGETRQGASAPGLGEFEPDRTGAIRLDDGTKPFALAEVSFVWGRNLTLGGSVASGVDGVRVDEVELAAGIGGWRASIGRIPVGYAHGRSGGVILTGQVPLDAFQVGTRGPFRIPFVSRLTGPFSFHTFLGRMYEDRHPGDPFFWGGSAQFEPHSRLTLGIHRAALFGGDRDHHPVTLGRIGEMLIGRVAGIGFEDQVVSGSLRLILPTEQVFPLTMYLEWGAEDAAGAWWDVPGRVGGIWAPALPFAPEVGLGLEYAHFGTSCCGNPKWYRHWSFNGAWASRDRTLGHPLGGDGRQGMVYGSVDALDSRLRMQAEVFYRDRRSENLFSPERSGKSAGGGLDVNYRASPRWEVRLRASGERAAEWSEARIQGWVMYLW